MAVTQFAVQMGMGTDLKGQDYTKAAAAAVRDALHRNFLTMHHAFDLPRDEMIVRIRVGVGQPDAVDLDRVKAEAPYGHVTAEAVQGGLDVSMMGETPIIAQAIVTVFFDVETAP